MHNENRLRLLDYFGMAAFVFLMLIMSYFQSRHRMFWSDELMGYLVIREHSFARMIHNWQLGLDSSSLFHMVCGRWWMELFGPTELSLRLFSATGMAASFVVLWKCARRFFSTALVACCVPFVYFLNPIVAWQFSNARMYGGFLLGAALASLAFVDADPRKPLRLRAYLLTFFAHAFLIASHILGLMYSGIFLAGLIAQDLYLRQFRPKLYLCCIAGWSVLALTVKNIQGTMALGRPAYWTVRPGWKDLIKGTTVFSRPLLEIIVILGLVALLLSFSRKVGGPADSTTPRLSLYFLLASYAAMLIVSFVVSRITTSIFLDRYLMPVILGDALLVCELVQRVAENSPQKKWARASAISIALIGFCAIYIARFRHPYFLPTRNFTNELVTREPLPLPMVIADIGLFAQMEFYKNDKRLMLTPVDWSVAADPDAGPGGAAGSREMDNWKSVGYFSDHILPTQDILSRFPRFLLVNEHFHTLWFRRYIMNNPMYTVLPQPTFRGDDVWLVERK